MKSRVLPRDEWHRLSVTQRPQIGPTVSAEDVKVIVVEDGDRIVSTMAVIRVVHYENLWIDPEYRGAVTFRLLKAAKEAAEGWSAKWVWGASDTDHMNDLISRLGGIQMPIQSFMIPLTKEVTCHS